MTTILRPDQRCVWSPQPGPQHALVQCGFSEILFGGARGGGKTDGILGKFGILAQLYGEAFNGIFFRRELPQADDLIAPAKIPLVGAVTWPMSSRLSERSRRSDISPRCLTIGCRSSWPTWPSGPRWRRSRCASLS
jgi:hypothetical protein